MNFEFFKAYPPNRDDVVVEIHVRQKNAIDVPAAVCRDHGQIQVTLFGREGGPAWEYPAAEFADALRRAIELLGGGGEG